MTFIIYLPSSSIIVIVLLLGIPTVTLPLLGSVDGSTVRTNFSLLSNILSSIIITLNKAVILPAGNVTLYGPAA